MQTKCQDILNVLAFFSALEVHQHVGFEEDYPQRAERESRVDLDGSHRMYESWPDGDQLTLRGFFLHLLVLNKLSSHFVFL